MGSERFALKVGSVSARLLSAFALAACLTFAAPVVERYPAAAREGPQSTASLAERLIDAVVNISTSQNVKGPQGVPLPRVPKGSPFEEHFEEFFNRRGSDNEQDRKVSSLGSGFVIDPSGLVVTNNHVIDGADEIIINFHDGSKLKVDKVLGKDTKTDLALLKVTPRKPLKFVKFGSSDRTRVGDWVMAIGNPFGLGGTVTVGIISAKQRDINSGPYDDYLQTDAAINKGNSGGPLFNMDGDVVGVNTAIISPTGGSIGIGFALPSDTATNVLAQLREFGETRRGWLGVRIQSVPDDMAEKLQLAQNHGALVSSVVKGSPAEKAEVQAQDVILTFDGKDVSRLRGLPRIVAETPVGKPVEMTIIRDGARKTLRVVVGRLDEDQGTKASKEEIDKVTERALAGLDLTPLSDSLRAQYGLPKTLNGLLIVKVDPKSPGGLKGLKPGQVIVEAAQEAVASIDALKKAIAKTQTAGRPAILLRVEAAKGGVRFVALPIK